jgi:hypothetical protein
MTIDTRQRSGTAVDGAARPRSSNREAVVAGSARPWTLAVTPRPLREQTTHCKLL